MNRRSFILSTAMASLIWPAASGTQALAADHPAVQFTRKVADDLIRAQMIGTVGERLLKVATRRVQIAGIPRGTPLHELRVREVLHVLRLVLPRLLL